MNGIGGKTIKEAKESMTLREASMWREYINRRGSINPARRIETVLTRLHYSYLKTHGAKDLQIEEMLPHEQPFLDRTTEEEQETPSAELLKMMLQARSNGKQKTKLVTYNR